MVECEGCAYPDADVSYPLTEEGKGAWHWNNEEADLARVTLCRYCAEEALMHRWIEPEPTPYDQAEERVSKQATELENLLSEDTDQILDEYNHRRWEKAILCGNISLVLRPDNAVARREYGLEQWAFMRQDRVGG